MNIWVPKFKIIEPKSEIKIGTMMRGHFLMEGVNSRTGRRRFLAEFDNLITDAGINGIGSQGGLAAACYVGSGGAEPLFTDTTMNAFVAATASVQSSSSSAGVEPDYWVSQSRTYRFAEGAAAGNLAEVGVASGTNPGTAILWSRALIVDGLGIPTTLTILSDEFLDVTYTVQFKPSTLVDDTYQVDIQGVTTDVISRPARVGTVNVWSNATVARGGFATRSDFLPTTRVYSGAIGLITSSPGGSAGVFSSMANEAYSQGSLQRDASYTWGLTQGNVGGVRSVEALLGDQPFGQGHGSWQFELNPVIPKDGTKIMSLSFRHTWARFVPAP